jgi:hypothetical protein
MMRPAVEHGRSWLLRKVDDVRNDTTDIDLGIHLGVSGALHHV